jgi:uncharacterized membrane protein
MLTTILIVAVIMMAIDLPYLTFIAAPSFRPMIQAIQGSAVEFKYWAAVPVYAALAYLITLADSPLKAAAIGGATYAVYDFTNLATIKKYTLPFAIMDTVWGATLFGITFSAARYFKVL